METAWSSNVRPELILSCVPSFSVFNVEARHTFRGTKGGTLVVTPLSARVHAFVPESGSLLPCSVVRCCWAGRAFPWLKSGAFFFSRTFFPPAGKSQRRGVTVGGVSGQGGGLRRPAVPSARQRGAHEARARCRRRWPRPPGGSSRRELAKERCAATASSALQREITMLPGPRVASAPGQSQPGGAQASGGRWLLQRRSASQPQARSRRGGSAVPAAVPDTCPASCASLPRRRSGQARRQPVGGVPLHASAATRGWHRGRVAHHATGGARWRPLQSAGHWRRAHQCSCPRHAHSSRRERRPHGKRARPLVRACPRRRDDTCNSGSVLGGATLNPKLRSSINPKQSQKTRNRVLAFIFATDESFDKCLGSHVCRCAEGFFSILDEGPISGPRLSFPKGSERHHKN